MAVMNGGMLTILGEEGHWPFGGGGARTSNGPLNLFRQRPTHSNEFRKLIEVDSDDFKQLRDLDLRVSFANITELRRNAHTPLQHQGDEDNRGGEGKGTLPDGMPTHLRRTAAKAFKEALGAGGGSEQRPLRKGKRRAELRDGVHRPYRTPVRDGGIEGRESGDRLLRSERRGQREGGYRVGR
ncbi:hypothetical protein V2J09_001763 [Rumex salicifolius]